MWCWERLEEISYIEYVKNEVLPTVKEIRNIRQKDKKR